MSSRFPTTYPPPLAKDVEAALLRSFLIDGDKLAGATVVLHNMRFVAKAAKRFLSTFSVARQRNDVEDLIQEGAAHLLRSLPKFDLARDVRFITFAGGTLWRVFQKYVYCDSPVTRTYRRKTSNRNLWDAAGMALSLEREIDIGGYTPSDPVSPRSVLQEEGPIDQDALVEAESHLRDIRRLRQGIATLRDSWREVVESRASGETLDVIGKRRGVSRERVRQLESRAIERLIQILD